MLQFFGTLLVLVVLCHFALPLQLPLFKSTLRPTCVTWHFPHQHDEYWTGKSANEPSSTEETGSLLSYRIFGEKEVWWWLPAVSQSLSWHCCQVTGHNILRTHWNGAGLTLDQRKRATNTVSWRISLSQSLTSVNCKSLIPTLSIYLATGFECPLGQQSAC